MRKKQLMVKTSISLPEKLLEEMQDAAEKADRSDSGYARQAIRAYIEGRTIAPSDEAWIAAAAETIRKGSLENKN